MSTETPEPDRLSTAVRRVLEQEAEWAAMRQSQEDETALDTYFDDAPATALLDMRQTGLHWRTGRKLTPWETQAWAQQWLQRFREWPHESEQGWQASTPEPDALDEADKVADDAMLLKADVLRLTGLSESTLKRWVKAGTFPAPIKLSPALNGWQAPNVKAWIRERIEISERKPRL